MAVRVRRNPVGVVVHCLDFPGQLVLRNPGLSDAIPSGLHARRMPHKTTGIARLRSLFDCTCLHRGAAAQSQKPATRLCVRSLVFFPSHWSIRRTDFHKPFIEKDQIMNTCTNRPLFSSLLAALGLLSASQLTAQIFTTLHSFSLDDRAEPFGSLWVLVGNVLYGTAESGGAYGNGTVFAINTNGTGLMTLHDFSASSDSSTNPDGRNPHGLILSDSWLYGTAYYGGSSDYGTVFRVNTNGTGFTTMHNFNFSEGAYPAAALVMSGNTLYGTTSGGGNIACGIPGGTVFAIQGDGSGFSVLHKFAGLPCVSPYVNSDGAQPVAPLIVSSNTLYGTTFSGGRSGWGTIFKVNIDGNGFTTLHSFSAYVNNASGIATNRDRMTPATGLVLSGNTLYGTTPNGGIAGYGTVFKINTDGTGFTVLYNSGGASTLLLSGKALYWRGVALRSATYTSAVNRGNTDGTSFANFYIFTPTSGPDPSTNADGAVLSSFILSRDTLYGTAAGGGIFGSGTIFSIALPVSPPLLVINAAARGSVILTWPTNATGFALQSAPDLTATFTNISGATSPYTNSIAAAQQYFRLISN